jgi:hypothetical protein
MTKTWMRRSWKNKHKITPLYYILLQIKYTYKTCETPRVLGVIIVKQTDVLLLLVYWRISHSTGYNSTKDSTDVLLIL